jgi:hypothetical protein
MGSLPPVRSRRGSSWRGEGGARGGELRPPRPRRCTPQGASQDSTHLPDEHAGEEESPHGQERPQRVERPLGGPQVELGPQRGLYGLHGGGWRAGGWGVKWRVAWISSLVSGRSETWRVGPYTSTRAIASNRAFHTSHNRKPFRREIAKPRSPHLAPQRDARAHTWIGRGWYTDQGWRRRQAGAAARRAARLRVCAFAAREPPRPGMAANFWTSSHR